MRKSLSIVLLLLVPALLVISGFYFDNDLLTSIGCILILFYIIMALRGKFSAGDKKK